MHRLATLLATATVALLGGCDNPVGEDRLPPPDPTQVTYAPSLNINLSQFTRTANGVYVQDQTVGTGATIANGDSVAVGYTGWLTNGTQFGSNQPSGVPLSFRVGSNSIIAGFGEGIPGMRVGGTRRIIIPSTLAYGRLGNPPDIPSNAVLVYSIVMSQRF